jgi:hypothetical protein
MAEIDRNCKFGCTATEWDHNFVDDIPFLLYRIEMLPLEIMRLQEAEQAVEKKRSVRGVYYKLISWLNTKDSILFLLYKDLKHHLQDINARTLEPGSVNVGHRYCPGLKMRRIIAHSLPLVIRLVNAPRSNSHLWVSSVNIVFLGSRRGPGLTNISTVLGLTSQTSGGVSSHRPRANSMISLQDMVTMDSSFPLIISERL